MKKTLTAAAALLLLFLASCSNEKGNQTKTNDRPVKAVRANLFLPYSSQFSTEVDIIEVDTLFRTGDVVRINSNQYKIIN